MLIIILSTYQKCPVPLTETKWNGIISEMKQTGHYSWKVSLGFINYIKLDFDSWLETDVTRLEFTQVNFPTGYHRINTLQGCYETLLE